jgi:acetyl esterase/lipase
MNSSITTSLACLIFLAGLAALPSHASAQQLIVPVWPDVAPGSEHWTQKEVEYLNSGKQRMVRNVVKPTLTAYLPERAKANGTAVVICPGGGFRFLSWDSEGAEVAKWLMERGISAFVLKYRLIDTGATEEEFQKRVADLFRPSTSTGGNPPPSDPELEQEKRMIPTLAAADGREAIKLVRQRASEWGIAADKIGILGFSAGAAVTMGVVMDHTPESRPNFAAPIYGGSTGSAPVPADAPPLFILVANDDKGASLGSAKLYSEWKAADKPVELHIYSKGGHGFGMNKRGLPVDTWIDRFGDWLAVQGLLKPVH